MQHTRKQILTYLSTKHTATATELSRSLNLTAANIRHHLSELIQQNAVEEVGHQLAQSRGRPTKIYCLSRQSMDHNLDFLAHALLQFAASGKPQEQSTDLTSKIARQMLIQVDIPDPFIQRLQNAICWLNDHNYRSRWEASQNGPRVTFGHCPYAAIIDTNPEMCQVDTALLSQLLGMNMQQVSKLERSPQGARHCAFKVGKA